MPTKNSTKTYVENGYYHVYNRGVEKRNIFEDTKDYNVFIDYLSDYLSPKDEKSLMKLATGTNIPSQERARLIRSISLKYYSSEITLFAFCLMPNHFHLFLRQSTIDGMDRLMSSLSTRYTMYFNKRHSRVGALCQGVYKAVLVTEEPQYLHLTRYIHTQAFAGGTERGQDYPSSYPEYLGLRKTGWLHPEEILSFFSKTNPKLSYETFVSEYNPIFDRSHQEFRI